MLLDHKDWYHHQFRSSMKPFVTNGGRPPRIRSVLQKAAPEFLSPSLDISHDINVTDANTWRLNVQYSVHITTANTRLIAVLSQADVHTSGLSEKRWYQDMSLYIAACPMCAESYNRNCRRKVVKQLFLLNNLSFLRCNILRTRSILMILILFAPLLLK